MKTLHMIHGPTPGLVWIGLNNPCPMRCNEPANENHHMCVARHFGLPDDNDPETRIYYCECSTCDQRTDLFHYFQSVNSRYVCNDCLARNHPEP